MKNLHIIAVDASASMDSQKEKVTTWVRKYIESIRKDNKANHYVGVYSFKNDNSIKKNCCIALSKITNTKLSKLNLHIKFNGSRDASSEDFEQGIEKIKDKETAYTISNENITIISDEKNEDLPKNYKIVLIEDIESTKETVEEKRQPQNLSLIIALLFLVISTTFVVYSWLNYEYDNQQAEISIKNSPEILAFKDKLTKEQKTYNPNIAIVPKVSGWLNKENSVKLTLEVKKLEVPHYPTGEYSIYKDKKGIVIKFAETAKNWINAQSHPSCTPITVKIVGVTDAEKLDTKKGRRYRNEIGTIKNYFTINNKKTEEKTFIDSSLIKDNEELACLRAYFMGDYLQRNSPIIACNQQNIKYFAETQNNKVGSYERRAEIYIDKPSYDYYNWLFIIVSVVVFLLCAVYIFAKNNTAPININLFNIFPPKRSDSDE